MQYAHWLIRLALAGIFLHQGFVKFPVNEAMAQMMGLPVWLWMSLAIGEIVAGALILVGGINDKLDWATRLAGTIMVIVMVGAIWKIHWGQWSFVANETYPMGGMQFQALVMACGLFFGIVGNRLVVAETASLPAE